MVFLQLNGVSSTEARGMWDDLARALEEEAQLRVIAARMLLLASEMDKLGQHERARELREAAEAILSSLEGVSFNPSLAMVLVLVMALALLLWCVLV